MRHIPAIYLRMDTQKRHFRRYMAKFRAIFRSKSAHGSKFPWDGSADPWDGNRNPWDGSTEAPLPAAFPTLKGGRTRASALTVCHIAHTAVGHFRRQSRGHPDAMGVRHVETRFIASHTLGATAPPHAACNAGDILRRGLATAARLPTLRGPASPANLLLHHLCVIFAPRNKT